MERRAGCKKVPIGKKKDTELPLPMCGHDLQAKILGRGGEECSAPLKKTTEKRRLYLPGGGEKIRPIDALGLKSAGRRKESGGGEKEI